jgi:hypothetical protein
MLRNPGHRGVFDGTSVRGASRRGERGGAIGRGVTGTGSHELPSFRTRNIGEILRAFIIHYKATSALLQWVVLLSSPRVSKIRLIKASNLGFTKVEILPDTTNLDYVKYSLPCKSQIRRTFDMGWIWQLVPKPDPSFANLRQLGCPVRL